MIKLSELTKLAEDKKAREDRLIEIASQKELNEFNKQYQDVVESLEIKLRAAAEEGKRHFIIFSRSAFGSGLSKIVTDELYSMMKKSGNYYCAWRDGIIKESDVIRCATGNFKRIYDYLKSQDLNPKIRHWMDNGGMDEGFEIVVNW